MSSHPVLTAKFRIHWIVYFSKPNCRGTSWNPPTKRPERQLHSWANLVPRVFRLFAQRGNAGKTQWGHRKNSIFLIGCSVTVSIVLPQKSCGNKIRCPQSLPGVTPLTKKPEDSGFEIAHGPPCPATQHVWRLSQHETTSHLCFRSEACLYPHSSLIMPEWGFLQRKMARKTLTKRWFYQIRARALARNKQQPLLISRGNLAWAHSFLRSQIFLFHLHLWRN